MKNLKSHFEMHIRFRNGIFLLAIIITCFIVGYHFYPFTQKKQNSFVELTQYQQQIDSLKLVAEQSKKEYIQKSFNPNFITEYKAYVLGLSSEELDRLVAYRKEGKWINSVSDFKIVTKVSDSLLGEISPLFKFPDWVTNNNRKTSFSKKKKYPELSFAQKGDLNTVSSNELQEKIGVPDFIAERIISYRNRLDGFVSDLQLMDIKGLYDSQRKKILAMYTTKNPKEIQKVNVNTASVKELMKVPYFDFETALEIRDLVKEKGKINSFEELRNVEGFSLEKIDRIALYLSLN